MRWPRRLSRLLFVACCLPAVGAAQSTPGNLQLNQYQPTPFSDRLLRLDGTEVLPLGQFRVGLDVDYAFRPLVLIDANPGIFQGGAGPEHNVVAHAVGGSFAATFGLSHGLEAAVVLPLTLFQTGETVAGAVVPSTAGVGNPKLGLKARLFDSGGFGLGAAVLAAIPVGTGTLTQDSGWSGDGRLFGEYQRGAVGLGLRAGLRLRGEQAFYDVRLGNELTFAAGTWWNAARRTKLFAELAGATAAATPFEAARQTPVEALLGLQQRFGKTWFTVAGGPGLREGYGSPVFRVVAAFTWANRPPDADGDGVPDDDDRCPTIPEDRDGFEDGDGCPDPDNDKDGILDAADKCPNAAEDRDGFEDGDGCPDPDNDKDGILDTADKCPDKPETVNDFEDDDGCPDEAPAASDKDKDGLTDDVDECPEEAEDKDGFEDQDGCPEPDNDKDGILDAVDKCPLEPETINGIDDEDGCPDKGPTQVRLGKNEIETLKPIYFDTDRSRVRHAFYNIMGQIASLLKAHPEIGRCAIEGHTDDTGPPDWNQKLSILRAESVIEFLANKGVDPKRLVAIGRGEHLPWASNETLEGRAKNRRVVFHIEGVNQEEEKKQEQRQERRRKIRQDQQRDQQRDQEKDREKDPEKRRERKPPPGSGAPEGAGPPSEVNVPVKPTTKSPPATVEPPPTGKAAATPSPAPPSAPKTSPAAKTENATNRAVPKATDKPTVKPVEGPDAPRAPAPSPNKPSGKSGPGTAPATPAAAPGDKAAAKPGSKPAAAGAAPGAAEDEEQVETIDGNGKRSFRAKRVTRRQAAPAGESPPTLRELLKLPPR